MKKKKILSIMNHSKHTHMVILLLLVLFLLSGLFTILVSKIELFGGKNLFYVSKISTVKHKFSKLLTDPV